MSQYLILILGFIFIQYALDCIVEITNLSTLQLELPKEFKTLYPEEKYRISQQYLKECTLYGLGKNFLSTFTLIVFILIGGFNTIDVWIRHHTLINKLGSSEILYGLCFLGILGSISFILQLPFSIYETFVLEEKYGFNKTSAKTFILDLIKGVLLGSLIVGLLFSGTIYFFQKTGTQGWLYIWIAMSFFQLLLSFLAPALIMPLFNKFTPLPEGSLKSAIEAFIRSQNFQIQGVFIMDGSKRSTKSNAFFTGFGKLRRLVLFDTLIEKHTEQELLAVLAHEIGHYKKRHILKSMLLSILSSGALLYILSQFLLNPNLFEAFQMQHISIYASIIFVSFLYSPILTLLSIVTNFISRRFEFEADEYAVQSYRKPQALIDALKKLSMDNFSHLTPHKLKVLFEYSHPPVLERIRYIKEIGEL